MQKIVPFKASERSKKPPIDTAPLLRSSTVLIGDFDDKATIIDRCKEALDTRNFSTLTRMDSAWHSAYGEACKSELFISGICDLLSKIKYPTIPDPKYPDLGLPRSKEKDISFYIGKLTGHLELMSFLDMPIACVTRLIPLLTEASRLIDPTLRTEGCTYDYAIYQNMKKALSQIEKRVQVYLKLYDAMNQ